jgi:hypothetical protein
MRIESIGVVVLVSAVAVWALLTASAAGITAIACVTHVLTVIR